MIYNMYKPSDRMLVNDFEANRMYHEQQISEYNEEQAKHEAEVAQQIKEDQEYINEMNDYINSTNKKVYDRQAFIMNVKEGFMTSCLYKLFKESVGFPMNESDKILGKNLVNRFVKENGVGKLMFDFYSSNNYILTEYARICDKYYNKVIESANDDSKEYNTDIISKDVLDDFYKELDTVDTERVNDIIRNRVADSVTEFIDTNSANKIEYEEIIKQAKDKISAIDGSDDVESVAESYINMAKNKINTLKTFREKNIFNVLVENITKSTFKDEGLKQRFIHEGAVDMDSITNSAQLMYTMLEMVNTTGMVNVDEEYIKKYLGI